ncbi:MAG: ATP-binding protein [Bacteroidetes bacterium]|nr:ATP-binding protein [Bacteroidota bacterium]
MSYPSIPMLKILSRTENLQKVREFIKQHAQQCGFDDDTVYNICLATDEACTNIIKHGYRNDRNQEIELHIVISPQSFVIRIFNVGKCFDPNSIEPPNVLKYYEKKDRGGYGIYLMKKLMDEVHFFFSTEQRNEVRLIKYR